MKKWIVLSILTGILCSKAIAQEKIIERYNTSGYGLLEVISKSNISLQIEGWQKDEIVISTESLSNTVTSKDIKIEKTDRGLRMTVDHAYSGGGSSEKRRGRLFISLPVNFDLNIQAGSSLDIEGVNGSITGLTETGDLSLTGINGTVDLNTGKGDIIISDSEVAGNAITKRGNLEIRNVRGKLFAFSHDSNVELFKDSDECWKFTSKNKTAYNWTEGRNVTKLKRRSEKTIRQRMTDSYIEKSDGIAKVITTGETIGSVKILTGNIIVDNLSTWIEAVTLDGEIVVGLSDDLEIEFAGDKMGRRIGLESLNGDIHLTFPEDISMEVDLAVEYTRDSGVIPEIESDFDLDIEKSEKWEVSWRHRGRKPGEQRVRSRYVTGKGSINGGKFRIYLRTVNGNIYLKKK